MSEVHPRLWSGYDGIAAELILSVRRRHIVRPLLLPLVLTGFCLSAPRAVPAACAGQDLILPDVTKSKPRPSAKPLQAEVLARVKLLRQRFDAWEKSFMQDCRELSKRPEIARKAWGVVQLKAMES